MSVGDCLPQSFPTSNPQKFGTPSTRVFKPLIRINGLVQDAPQGWLLTPCYLDMAAIAESHEVAAAIAAGTGGGGGTGKVSMLIGQTASAIVNINDTIGAAVWQTSTPGANPAYRIGHGVLRLDLLVVNTTGANMPVVISTLDTDGWSIIGGADSAGVSSITLTVAAGNQYIMIQADSTTKTILAAAWG